MPLNCSNIEHKENYSKAKPRLCFHCVNQCPYCPAVSAKCYNYHLPAIKYRNLLKQDPPHYAQILKDFTEEDIKLLADSSLPVISRIQQLAERNDVSITAEAECLHETEETSQRRQSLRNVLAALNMEAPRQLTFKNLEKKRTKKSATLLLFRYVDAIARRCAKAEEKSKTNQKNRS